MKTDAAAYFVCYTRKRKRRHLNKMLGNLKDEQNEISATPIKITENHINGITLENIYSEYCRYQYVAENRKYTWLLCHVTVTEMGKTLKSI